ncbi:CDP-diacylglycerol--glycerol-3-phosphate 3-phosphatidyltransferase [Thermodesulfobacteriota bacterium]
MGPENTPKEMLIHPNSLTLYRVATVPALILFLLFPTRLCMFLAAILFSLAAITDYLDGYFARRFGLESNLGKFLDPLADKLLVVSALIMLVSHRFVPAWIVCIIVGRELAVTGLRGIASDKGVVMAATLLGKYKTGFQIAAIIPLLIHYSYFGINFHAIGTFFLYCALLMTVVSALDYFRGFFGLIQ